MKSVKYKVDPTESNPKNDIVNDANTTKIILFNKKFDYENENENDDFDNEVDEAVKDDYDADEDDDYEINEIVVTNGLASKFGSKIRKKDEQNITLTNNKQSMSQMPNQTSDSASSSESGFGTVDDNENQNSSTKTLNHESIQIENRKSQQLHSMHQKKSIDSTSSTQPLAANTNNKSCPHLISFPILQPPRQVVYELNTNNSDDVVNILNDNSSMNSSTSSKNSNILANCCSKLIDKIITFYYSCFCCYSASSHNNHTPMICSWLTIFCCCCPFFGGISLYLTHRSRKYKMKQKYDLADKYSNYAEKLNIAALIFGIIFYAIAFFMITLVIFMYWRPNRS